MASPTLSESEPQTQPSLSATGRTGVGLAIVAALLALAGARQVQWEDVDGYGLISALPAVYWVGVAIGLAATYVLLSASRDHELRYATAIPIMWLVVLHTATQMAHYRARFAIVWTHLGFVRLIEETGTSPVERDARFAWPGLFGAAVAPIADLPETVLDLVMRMWPTYITGGTAILVAVLARRAYPTVPLIGSLSALSYVLLAWTGQDYFSPQSVGYLFQIAILVVVESGPLRPGTSWASNIPVLSSFVTGAGDRPAARSAPSVAALTILGLGAVVSHPLAPFFVCAGLLILALYGRRMAWRLLVFIGLAYAVWFLISAEPFWSSRISELLGNVGRPGSIYEANTSSRVVSADNAREFVTGTRALIGLGTFVAVLAIGLAMVASRFRSLRPAIPLVPLAGVPVLAAALQSYGGEIAIRVLLFSVPLATILMGRLLAMIRPQILPAVVTVLAAAIIPFFLIARFGNEEFEMTTEHDRDAIEAAYDHADSLEAAGQSALFVADNHFINWRDQHLGVHDFTEQPFSGGHRDWDECGLKWIEQHRVHTGNDAVIVVLTRTQAAWNVRGRSENYDDLDVAADWLLERAGTELIYRGDHNTWVLEIDTTNTADVQCETS